MRPEEERESAASAKKPVRIRAPGKNLDRADGKEDSPSGLEKKVLVASLAGFCFGVRRAVDFVEGLLAEKKPNERICTLGHLIHNRQVMESFSARGVKVAEEGELRALVSSACKTSPVVLAGRAHGIERDLYRFLIEAARENPFFSFYDLTCPYVAKIHRIAREMTDEKELFVVFGDAAHPEVRGIVSYARGEHVVVSSAEECERILLPRIKSGNLHVVAVAQTTQKLSEWKKVELFLKKVCTNAKIFDTICSVTENRQKEAASLAGQVDLMIVAGGRHSANTRSLYETIRQKMSAVCLVEEAKELRALSLAGHTRVGITAGASTPRYIIEEVEQTMSEMLAAKEEIFAELLEGSLKTLNTGDIVTGVITSISATEIHVDLSTKGTGILPAEEMPLDPETGKPLFKVGDEIEAFVVRVSDLEGVVGLSRRKIEKMSEWKKIAEAYKEGTVLEGKVSDVIKGGLVVTSGVSRIFIPASQTGVPKDGDMSALKGTIQQFTIIEIDEHRNRAVGSIKAVLRAKRREAQEKFWNTVEEGMKFEGTVKSLTSYGAFVDLGGVDGMVHVSELSWSRIKNPAEVVSVGDKISVYVKSFDKEKKRISLGCKTEENNPWNLFTSRFSEGDVAPVKIVGLTPFGAFAEIIPDVDGLIHISQIADRKIGNPAEYLALDQVVQAKIIGIDQEKKKVSLSIRALLDENDTAEDEDGGENSSDGEPASAE